MTDKLREAAQMALDALNSSVPFGWSTSYVDKHRAATEALRAALAQPEREWQGLTPEDKRIAGIPLHTNQISISDAFDVIERILKEKNI